MQENPLAAKLNAELEAAAPEVLGMLSAFGQRAYFPRGILSQTAEAREKADRFNATISTLDAVTSTAGADRDIRLPLAGPGGWQLIQTGFAFITPAARTRGRSLSPVPKSSPKRSSCSP